MLPLEYIAGFFDGEGNVGIYPKGTGGSYFLRTQLTQGKSETSLGIMQELQGRFGGNISEQPTTSGGRKYNWQINANAAADFLEAIAPHLVLKREQALFAIEWQRGKPARTRDERGRMMATTRPGDREAAERIKLMKRPNA